MIDSRKSAAFVVTATLAACAVMAFVDGVIEPPYAVKSAVKLVLFVGAPILFMLLTRNETMKRMIKPNARGIVPSLIVGALVYIFIVGGYFALRGVFDFSAVTASLAAGEGVTRENFPFVAVYISFCNSISEEIMFRAFAFGALAGVCDTGAKRKLLVYAFSSVAFAAYHVAIMSGWFSPLLFALLMLGLFAGGVIFIFFDDKVGELSIYPSWIIHIFANLGINTVGLILFGII